MLVIIEGKHWNNLKFSIRFFFHSTLSLMKKNVSYFLFMASKIEGKPSFIPYYINNTLNTIITQKIETQICVLYSIELIMGKCFPLCSEQVKLNKGQYYSY